MLKKVLHIICIYGLIISCKATSKDVIITSVEPKNIGVTINESLSSISATFNKSEQYTWFDLKIDTSNWKNNAPQKISASLSNLNDQELEVFFWIYGNKSWYAVSDIQMIPSRSSQSFSCNLTETFPDGTLKLIPSAIEGIRIMLKKPIVGSRIKVSGLKLENWGKAWSAPKDRIEIPDIQNTPPNSGRRVKYQLRSDINSKAERYSVLYLPKKWSKDKKYPIVVEYPGNIYFTKNCFSTGKPDQCQIGYGMTKGESAIWVSIPFVEYSKKGNILNGWGNPDDTADYTLKTIKELISKFSGDPKNVFVTGFSRGAIACRFIGLRNNELAKLWKGFHECQHYDGDGWNGSTYSDAKKRLRKLKRRSMFQTDNEHAKLKEMLPHKNVTYVKSGLGFHATTMFLDDRNSTKKLRAWFNKNIEIQ